MRLSSRLAADAISCAIPGIVRNPATLREMGSKRALIEAVSIPESRYNASLGSVSVRPITGSSRSLSTALKTMKTIFFMILFLFFAAAAAKSLPDIISGQSRAVRRGTIAFV